MTVLKRRWANNSGADPGFSVGGADLLVGQNKFHFLKLTVFIRFELIWIFPKK